MDQFDGRQILMRFKVRARTSRYNNIIVLRIGGVLPRERPSKTSRRRGRHLQRTREKKNKQTIFHRTAHDSRVLLLLCDRFGV